MLALRNQRTNRIQKGHLGLKKYGSSYVLILPFFVLYLYFTFYPMVRGFIVSLQNYQILGKSTYVGMQNYKAIFHDPLFVASIWHTLIFVVISVPLVIVIGFLLALLVNVPMRGQTFFRAVFFIPVILSVSVVATMWNAIFGTYGGLVDSILSFFGMKEQINWAGQQPYAWIAVIIITIWWTSGFNMILYLAGLQDIPAELYEAAKIDGASPWQCLRYITIPSLRGVTFLITFLQIIASFNIFGQVYSFNGGGPEGSLRMMIQYIWETTFNQFSFGPGAAASYVFFAILLVVSVVLTLFRRTAN